MYDWVKSESPLSLSLCHFFLSSVMYFNLLANRQILRCIFLIHALLGLQLVSPGRLVNLTLPNDASDLSSASMALLTQPRSNDTKPFSQSLNFTALQLACNARLYGIISNPESCVEAWLDIPKTSDQLFTFGSRILGSFEVPLPQRFLGCKIAIYIQFLIHVFVTLIKIACFNL